MLHTGMKRKIDLENTCDHQDGSENSDLCESRLEWLPETESGEETEPRPDFCFACVRM